MLQTNTIETAVRAIRNMEVRHKDLCATMTPGEKVRTFLTFLIDRKEIEEVLLDPHAYVEPASAVPAFITSANAALSIMDAEGDGAPAIADEIADTSADVYGALCNQIAFVDEGSLLEIPWVRETRNSLVSGAGFTVRQAASPGMILPIVLSKCARDDAARGPQGGPAMVYRIMSKYAPEGASPDRARPVVTERLRTAGNFDLRLTWPSAIGNAEPVAEVSEALRNSESWVTALDASREEERRLARTRSLEERQRAGEAVSERVMKFVQRAASAYPGGPHLQAYAISTNAPLSMDERSLRRLMTLAAYEGAEAFRPGPQLASGAGWGAGKGAQSANGTEPFEHNEETWVYCMDHVAVHNPKLFYNNLKRDMPTAHRVICDINAALRTKLEPNDAVRAFLTVGTKYWDQNWRSVWENRHVGQATMGELERLRNEHLDTLHGPIELQEMAGHVQ